MQTAFREIERDQALAHTVLHDQIDRKVLDEKLRVVLQRLLIEGVQHRVAGSVRRRARPLSDPFSIACGHTTERTLVYSSILRPRERHPVVLELDYRSHSLTAHVFDGVLVPEPIGTLDSIVHVPFPMIFSHIAERRADTALGGDCVATRRENLGDARRR